MRASRTEVAPRAQRVHLALRPVRSAAHEAGDEDGVVDRVLGPGSVTVGCGDQDGASASRHRREEGGGRASGAAPAGCTQQWVVVLPADPGQSLAERLREARGRTAREAARFQLRRAASGALAPGTVGLELDGGVDGIAIKPSNRAHRALVSEAADRIAPAQQRAVGGGLHVLRRACQLASFGAKFEVKMRARRAAGTSSGRHTRAGALLRGTLSFVDSTAYKPPVYFPPSHGLYGIARGCPVGHGAP